ncbi:MAG: OmpH family outer membrane protein [Ferruginibacter sp.]
MKKLFVVAVMALAAFSASAQKIGYISPDELIGVMPEADKADKELQGYQEELAKQGQDMMKDLTVKDSLFVKDSAKLSPTMKDLKRRELIELYQKVQGWQNQAQDLYNAEAQKKIAPIRAKALDAVKAVAKENGYTYVLDVSSVIVAPPGDDLLPLVKKKLGIKDTPATPGAAAPRN